MPTNVPPQYREAEDRFRQATTTQAKIVALQEMMIIMPKHKGTDHLKGQLRAKMSELMSELEGESKGKRGPSEPFALPKQGGGRAVLIGPTNVGKSLLLLKSTGAQTRVGAYALSTLEPVPGMLQCRDVPVQFVDTPPITNKATQGRLYGLLRTSDVFVIVVDLSMDAVAQAQEVFSDLAEWGFTLLGRDDKQDEDRRELSKQTVLVGNKADIPDALEQYLELDAAYSEKYPVIMASAEESIGLDELGEEIFQALKMVRVYTKSPREKIEEFQRVNPMLLPIGGTVEDAATKLHKDLGRGLKFAVLWGESSRFEGQRVGRDHQLTDGDVVELHA